MSIANLTYAVHPIGISTDKVEKRKIQDEADLKSFVQELISSKLLQNENRKFHWPSDTALVPSLLKKMSGNSTEREAAMQTMAERLLEKEKDAQKKVEKLDIDIQKGSLIQIIFKNDNTPCVLLVKVHLARFLGESDYKKHDGYPLDNTVLKMCYVEFDDQYKPSKVAVADSNSTLSEYWWKGFLVLPGCSGEKTLVKTAVLGAPIRRGPASPLRVATGGAANWGSGVRPRRSPAPANGTARAWFWTGLAGSF
jgi:hypothetical protein